MENFKETEHQHLRFNPLKDEWVLVSPHRCLRPWSGQIEDQVSEDILDDQNNPLKPGAVRANGKKNPPYTSTFVFPNDFPALLQKVPEPPQCEDPLFQMSPAKGTCRVMCFHPDSKITLPLMSIDEILAVINEWVNQMTELSRKYVWVQIFENKGSVMGCSNPHPHCQIWSSNFLPNEPRIKDRTQKDFYDKYGKPMLQDYAEKELLKKERIVLENEEWIVVVPYWAIWPFETIILPKHGRPQTMMDLCVDQKFKLAEIIKKSTTIYDNLFNCRFPYSMGWHEVTHLGPLSVATGLLLENRQKVVTPVSGYTVRYKGREGAPTGPNHTKGDCPHWIFHGIYLPPLLRSARVKKFMVGYELLAQSQRDLTAEQAAEKLRKCDSRKHYSL